MSEHKTDHIDFIVGQWQEERPDLESQPIALIGRTKRLYTHLRNQIEGKHKEFGLAWGEFDVLATLLRSGTPYCLTPTALFRSAMLTSGAMTNRLNKLEERKLIERLPDPEDRRSLLVKLTDEGFSLISEAMTQHVDLEKELIAVLNQQERDTLDAIFKKWLAAFE